MSLPFLTPVTCALAFLGWLLILGQWSMTTFGGIVIPSETYSLVQNPFYTAAMNYWAAALFFVGIPLCVISYLHTLKVAGMKKSMPYVLLLPYYWTFIGMAATCSFFKNTQNWGRTER